MDIRREPRYSISTHGRIRRGFGVRFDVNIKNLSEYGCHFTDLIGRLQPGEEITLRIGDVGPLAARVRWTEDHRAGVEFDHPLYPAVLDHIVATGGQNKLPA